MASSKTYCGVCDRVDGRVVLATCKDCEGCAAHCECKGEGISSKELAKQYKERARAERAAGGKISIDRGLPSLSVTLSDGAEYYWQEHQAEHNLDEAKKDMKENGLEGKISLEDYILAQAQNW